MRKIFCLMGMVLLGWGLASANANTINWTNLSGGAWSNPANWDANTVPGANDSAFITAPGAYTVTLDTNATVTALILGAATGGQTFNWSASNLMVTNFTINTNGILTVTGGAKNLGGSITNNGTINWATTNALGWIGSYALNNNGVFNLQTDFNASASQDYVQYSFFNNRGTILATNPGPVQFNIGSIFLTNWGTLDAGTNANLVLSAPPFSCGPPVYNPPVTFQSGTIFGGDGTNTFTNCLALMDGAITLNSTFEFAGTLLGTNVWSGPGNFVWTGGYLGYPSSCGPVPPGSTTFTSNFNAYIGSIYNATINNQVLNNQGTLTVSTPNGTIADGGNPGLINNSGTIVLKHTTSFRSGTINGTPFSYLVNTGTITAPANLGMVAVFLDGWALTNSGILNSDTNSTLDLNTPGDPLSPNLLFLADGTTLQGAGGITAAFSSGYIYFNANGKINLNTEFTVYGYLQGNSVWNGSGTFNCLNLTMDWPGSSLTFGPTLQTYFTNLNCSLALNGSAITNQGTATINFLGLSDTSQTNLPSVFNNSGTLNLINGLILMNSAGSVFSNSGTIFVPNGRGANLGGGGASWKVANTGTIAISTNSSLHIIAAKTELDAGTVINGAGNLLLGDYDSMTITANGNLTVNGNVELFNAATLIGTQTWNGTGSLTWSGGTITQPGTTTFGPNFHLQVTNGMASSRVLSQGHVLNNQGTVNWTAGGGFLASNQVTVINSGSWVFSNNFVMQTQTSDCSFFNEAGGTLQLFGAAEIDAPLTNSGMIDLETGSLNATNGYQFAGSSAHHFTVGAGTDQLQVSAFNPSGALNVTLASGVTVTTNSVFTLATYGSHSGTFGTTQFPPLPPTLAWKLNYGPTALTLQAVAAPRQLSAPKLLANGSFQFSLSGAAAAGYQIQVSTDLFHWTLLQSNGPFTGSVTITDTNASGNFSRRFYRALLSN